MWKSKRIRTVYIGAVLLILATITFIYWGNRKQVWFCDEIYTYESANGFEQDWPAANIDQWMTGADVERFFSADSQTLSLNDISTRLYCDHVPLYFWLFRILSFYFFKGSGTVWIGLSLNLFFFLGFTMVTYGIFQHLTESPEVSGACVLVTCLFNRLMLEQATMLRMYMMLLLLEGLLLLGGLWILLDVQRGKMKPGVFLYLFIVSLLGFLTHYDYWIFYAFTAAFFCLWLLFTALRKKKAEQVSFWKSLEFRYVLAWIGNFVGSLLTTILLFPYCRWNLNRGKGEIALHSIFHFSDEKLQHIAWGYRRLSGTIFGDKLNPALGVMIIFGCIIGGAVILYRKKKFLRLIGLSMTVLICQAYQLAVCFTMPDVAEERYLWGAYTFMMLCMVYGVVLLLQAKPVNLQGGKVRKVAKTVVTVLLLIGVLVAEYDIIDEGRGIAYLAHPDKDITVLEENSDIPWIVYGPTVGVYSYYDWLMPKQICFLTMEQTMEDIAAVSELDDENRFVLYIYEEYCTQALDFFERELNKEFTAEYLTKSTNLTVYLVSAKE